MWTWFQNQGAKALTGLVTVLAVANGTEPQAVADLFGGDTGKRWVAFALAIASLAHTVFLKPVPKPTVPQVRP